MAQDRETGKGVGEANRATSTPDHRYLVAGLSALARAHRANAMAGHLGAALLAGSFFCEDHPELDPGVVRAIQREMDRILAGEEALWFDAEKAGITIAGLFEPFPASGEVGVAEDLAHALAGNIGELRQSGHNVIFAALSLRALRDHPDLGTRELVEGLRKLIERFDDEGPGRGYYGKARGWIAGREVDLSAEPPLAAYADAEEMSVLVIDEILCAASKRRQGFGGLFHLINHATALLDLERFGCAELARAGLAAHHRHLRLLRSLPDLEVERGPLRRATHDPRTPAYWAETAPSQWSAQLTHRIKTLYGFFSLVRSLEAGERRTRAEQQFLYLMA